MSKTNAVGVLLAAAGVGVWLWQRQQAGTLPAWLSPIGPSWQQRMGNAPVNYDPDYLINDYLGTGDGINWQASTAGPGVTVWKTPAAGQRFEAWFRDASAAYGLPDGLLSRQAWQESRYNPQAHNVRTDARGLMQIVPRWHPEISDPFDPRAAIYYAASLLAQYRRKLGGWDKALAAYNQGYTSVSGIVRDYGANWLAALSGEARNYVTQIGLDVGLIGYGPAQGVA